MTQESHRIVAMIVRKNDEEIGAVSGMKGRRESQEQKGNDSEHGEA
jgi:hypothetical protein